MKKQGKRIDNATWLLKSIIMGHGRIKMNGHEILNAVEVNFRLANGAGGRNFHIVIIKGDHDHRNHEHGDKKTDDLSQ